ncbi:MAG TPA: serine/threonine-protein kinase [Polyangiaceae bacterium]|nr:serine/threonine-protein kinase [Polyangiaceae bacterium]
MVGPNVKAREAPRATRTVRVAPDGAAAVRRVLTRIALGSTAEIVLAEVCDPAGRPRQVVLKWLLPHLLDDALAAARLHHEGRLLSRLSHPNLVGFRGAGVHQGRPFVALEPVGGATLEAWLTAALAGVRLPFEVVVALVADVAEGLAHAHAATADGAPLRVVHRDLCPRNVIVRPDGRVKLLDFGLAASVWAPPTQPGALVGTPAYAAPEQVRGLDCDGRADVFALGVLLHELTTGRRLFRRPGVAATSLAVLEASIPRPRTLRADLPADLEAAVMQALQRDPTRRCPSARALARSLDPWRDAGRPGVVAVAARVRAASRGEPAAGA